MLWLNLDAVVEMVTAHPPIGMMPLPLTVAQLSDLDRTPGLTAVR